MEDKNVCQEPCGSAIEVDVRWIKENFNKFQEHYNTAHQTLIKQNEDDHREIVNYIKNEVLPQVKATNGHVAEIKIWKERINGAIVVLSALGVVAWLGKYVIAFLEK